MFLDRLARLAADLLGTPVAQVNVVLPDRQRSLVSVGSEPDWSGPQEVSLDFSFCKHVVESGERLVIDNTRTHPLVRDNRGTTESGIGAYAAVPLMLDDEVVLGTLCVVDFEPRAWSDADLDRLVDLESLARAVLSERLARNEAEGAVRVSQRRYREIFDNSPAAIVEFSTDGQVVTANPAMVDLLGYESLEELQTVDIQTEVYADPQEQRRLQTMLREEGEISNEEVRLTKKDGEVVWAVLDGVGVTDEEGEFRYVQGFARDFTRERSLREQLIHAQKMEVVGTLAGGVAHDFNNLLTVIMANSDLLSAEASEASEEQEEIQEIRQAAEQAKAVMSQLLTFSRKAATHPEQVDVNRVVQDGARILRRLLRDDVKLEMDLTGQLPAVVIDRTHLEQVIMNLVINAQDAMPGGGHITVSTGEVVLDEKYAASHADADPGRRVQLAVQDTGQGMDAETQRHIFEPFYTTKERGQGTGLGLSTVYGVVQEAGGHIGVYSEPGRGTVFKVYLHPGKGSIAESRDGGTPDRQQLEGDETLLLVDDDEAVGNTTRRVLEAFGYRVFLASTPDEALEIWGEENASVDAVVTDVVLPDRRGPELVEEFRKQEPRLPVLFMSGYGNDHLLAAEILTLSDAFVEKPFTPLTLVGAIRELLDRVGE